LKPKQFIVLIPTRDHDYIVATSRQYTKEIAARDVSMRLDNANIPFKKMHVQELVVEDDGTIRIVDDNGEVLPLATWKV
jgi:hypothetical protein